MTGAIFKALAFFLGIYALIPTVLARFFHLGVLYRAPGGAARVALTFDDGPDPRYTPQVLNILQEFKVKACFFVLGKKIKAYPELVARIHQEGHEIASHGYHHRLPWLLGWRGMKQELQITSTLIAEITGQPPTFYRPPWGLFNLHLLFLSWLSGQQVVLWSFMCWDWNRRSTPSSIAQKALSCVKNGSILVFHDSDDTPGAALGAPKKMLDALPIILTELKARNLEITPLKELLSTTKLAKNLLRRLWQKWEKLISFLARIEDVVENGKPIMFRVALRKYRGSQCDLPDGVILRPGDLIGELHMHNEMLQSLSGSTDPASLAFAAKKAASSSLRTLARWLKKNPRYQNIKAIAGLSILHRGSQVLGFHDFEAFPLLSRLATWYESLLLMIFHPAGKARIIRNRKKLKSRWLAMSKEELFRRYLDTDKNIKI